MHQSAVLENTLGEHGGPLTSFAGMAGFNRANLELSQLAREILVLAQRRQQLQQPATHTEDPTPETLPSDAEIWERFSELCHRMNRNKSDLANELFGRVAGAEDILAEHYGV